MTSLLPLNLYSMLLAAPTSAPAMPDAQTAGKWLDRAIAWFKEVPREWLIYAVVIGVALIVLRRVLGGLGRAWRRSKPVNINPKLAKYNVDRAEVARQQRELAVQIEATSTGRNLAGYRIIRQVEAVFVEGYAAPEEALIALKAAAAERGANAVLNLKTARTTAGRCTASGDAVVVVPTPATRPPLGLGPQRICSLARAPGSRRY